MKQVAVAASDAGDYFPVTLLLLSSVQHHALIP